MLSHSLLPLVADIIGRKNDLSAFLGGITKAQGQIMAIRITSAALVALALSGCAQPAEIFGEESLIVNTPRYQANKVLYLKPPGPDSGDNMRRWSEMIEPHALSQDDPLLADAVQNGDPVAIVVNRVALPESLTADFGPGTRDIAVLLDFAGSAGVYHIMPVRRRTPPRWVSRVVVSHGEAEDRICRTSYRHA